MANKYHARKVTINGIVFDSKKEAEHYMVLLSRKQAGEIWGLAIHPKFELYVNDVRIGRYTADFSYYTDHTCKNLIVVDVKGVRTRDYILRKKLMKALYNIDVQEV